MTTPDAHGVSHEQLMQALADISRQIDERRQAADNRKGAAN